MYLFLFSQQRNDFSTENFVNLVKMSTFAKYNNKLINLACAKCIMIDVDLYFQQTKRIEAKRKYKLHK